MLGSGCTTVRRGATTWQRRRPERRQRLHGGWRGARGSCGRPDTARRLDRASRESGRRQGEQAGARPLGASSGVGGSVRGCVVRAGVHRAS